MVKFVITVLLLSCCCLTNYAQPVLKKKWQTDTILSVPESILLDQQHKQLYVSLIGTGNPSAVDGNGSIGILDLNGKIITTEWAKGLNSPKGMGIHGSLLYVADLKEVAIIDLKTGNILKKIQFPAAGMLNDISIDKNGLIYISDSKGGKIYSLMDQTPSIFLDSLINPNGLLAVDDHLYFLDSGSLFSIDRAKHITKIASGMKKSTDGLQQFGNDFLVSCWIGAIYHVQKNGKVDKLIDTESEQINTADFAFDSEQGVLYLPTFFKNYVAAFKVE